AGPERPVPPPGSSPGGYGPRAQGPNAGGGGSGPPRRAGRGPGGSGPGGDDGRSGKPRKRSIIWRWRRPLFLVGLAMLALLAGVSAYFASVELPEIDPLAQTSYICMADVAEGCTPENAMAKLQGKDTENRTNVRLDELPEHVVNAVIAVEDRDFFEHRGVNPMSIGRALYRDLRGDGIQQGGSTITQQFVKNAFLGSERSLSRKVKEAVLSLKLEQRMSKEEILEGYLNKIYFGRNAHGIAAASHAYFGKDVREIGLAEAAFLAGVIRAPELPEPEKHPEEAARRRKTALVAMQEEGYITAEQAAEADAVPLEEPHLRPRRELKLIDTLKGA